MTKEEFSSSTDHQLLQRLLSYAKPDADIEFLAKQLMAEFGENSASMFDAPEELLQRVAGSKIAALISLVSRLIKLYWASRWMRGETFDSIQGAASYLRRYLGVIRREAFWVIALNPQNRMIATEQIQTGSVNRTAVFPRLVVEVCIKHFATAVILAHNHPSGKALPSNSDQKLTQKLLQVLSHLDIVLQDHIIIAGEEYYSFAEAGKLTGSKNF